jgi:hypothetical protein
MHCWWVCRSAVLVGVQSLAVVLARCPVHHVHVTAAAEAGRAVSGAECCDADRLFTSMLPTSMRASSLFVGLRQLTLETRLTSERVSRAWGGSGAQRPTTS